MPDLAAISGDTAAVTSGGASASRATLRFGAIADIQYADIEDRRGRRYRAALSVVDSAVDFFNCHDGLNFLLHAGDILDFYNTDGEFAGDGGRATAKALGDVMERLSRARCPKLVSLIGNHELYNWSRTNLLAGLAWTSTTSSGTLRFCPEGCSEFWHDFSPAPGWRCIVLDSYAESLYRGGRTAKAPPFSYELDADALERLIEKNPNVAEFVRQRPGENILCDYFKGVPDGPEGRWVPFNGGLGQKQLEWLRERLEAARAAGEAVVLFSHCLVHPASSVHGGRTLLWDYAALLDVLHSPCGKAVQLVISGHQHEGGFFTDEHGIHFVVLESPLNTSPNQPGSYLVVEADAREVRLTGYGNARSPIFPGVEEGTRAVSRSLPLRTCLGSQPLESQLSAKRQRLEDARL
eukprot:TRINITY_DN47238_c0_g1_i1.p1 TRINITY_DN47238_c0_g1~~TRINITY_DN47238_c0_g1_i1.p1  ORF type:complete len:430 (+),score=63.18 TRINITY_DN47238_c0_g1_i1:67-1290(+)